MVAKSTPALSPNLAVITGAREKTETKDSALNRE
jgi:hypothetical protein